MPDHCGTIKIETERLILRRFERGDVSAVFKNWAADEEVFRFMTSPLMPAERDVERYIEEKIDNYEKKSFYYWAIVPKDEGEPVGMAAFTEISDWKKSANIAYALGRNWWGRGYAREACLAVMELMFKTVGMKIITGSHFTGNDRSGKTLLSLGMRYIGRSALPVKQNGEYLYCEDYGITAKRFFNRENGDRQ